MPSLPKLQFFNLSAGSNKIMGATLFLRFHLNVVWISADEGGRRTIMTTEKLISTYISTYWRNMATQNGRRRRCMPTYIPWCTLFLGRFEIQLAIDAIQFEPPGKILVIVLRRFSTVVVHVVKSGVNNI